MKIYHAIAITGLLLFSNKSYAGPDVTFTATLVSSCVLSLSSAGTLTASADGTSLSSENSGGSAATLTVVAVGLTPSVQFGTPQLTAPTLPGSSTTSIRWQSASGKTQAYTTSSSTASNVSLIDSFTVNTKVESAHGFASGNYSVRSTVTCQQ